jgi:CubicO group peptidase (beta-lactamase class C family)
MVIEAASGQPYHKFIEQRLFRPAQMRDSAFDTLRRRGPRRAQGYRLTAGRLERAPTVNATVAWSAGGFLSTVADLVRWASALEKDTLLQQVSRAQMLEPYPETAAHGMHYGYGIVLGERFGRRLQYHAGGISGFNSVLQNYPETGLIIAVMSNLDADSAPATSWTVADGLARMLLEL